MSDPEVEVNFCLCLMGNYVLVNIIIKAVFMKTN